MADQVWSDVPGACVWRDEDELGASACGLESLGETQLARVNAGRDERGCLASLVHDSEEVGINRTHPIRMHVIEPSNRDSTHAGNQALKGQVRLAVWDIGHG
jgi:hypothetical protein